MDAACVGGSASLGDAGPQKCIAGETQPCVGAGACAGGQACKEDGRGYEACVCGSGPELDGSAPAGMVAIPGHPFRDGGVIAAFYMDKTEVTVSAYASCVSAGTCTVANTAGSSTDESCNAGVAGRDNHLVNCVDWDQSKAYCKWAGKRLPTQDEWQYAADTADGRLYPWGNAAPDTQLCWSGSGAMLDAGKRTLTCVVGSFPTGDSPFGVSDMSGNVWEWTSSEDASTPFPLPVFRGGGWDVVDGSKVGVASRNYAIHSYGNSDLGFRCSR